MFDDFGVGDLTCKELQEALRSLQSSQSELQKLRQSAQPNRSAMELAQRAAAAAREALRHDHSRAVAKEAELAQLTEEVLQLRKEEAEKEKGKAQHGQQRSGRSEVSKGAKTYNVLFIDIYRSHI